MTNNPDAELDRALARLNGETTLDDRLDVLKSLVTYWYGEMGAHAGVAEEELAGIQMPSVLRWWYRWAGRREVVLSGCNCLLPPALLKVKDGLLCFYGEQCWVYEWATETVGNDPPVFGRFSEKTAWTREPVCLSEHLILAALFEATMTAKYAISAAWLPGTEVQWIAERLPLVSLGPWNWNSTRFYAASGAFMVSMENYVHEGQLGYSIWIGAKTPSPLMFLKEIVDHNWEYGESPRFLQDGTDC